MVGSTKGSTMGREERRDTSDEQKEVDPRTFENISREERGEQSPSIGEEGTEEDRRQWEKTRDLHEEAKQITEKADEPHRKEGEENHDRPEG
jgi:hypothetical protein